MSDYPISDTPRRMGRPTLHVKPTMVRLPDGVAERIDNVAGKNRRAEFIRDAVERELKKRERSTNKNVDGTTPRT